MKIKISEINKILHLLEKIPYNPINENSKIFFEIDCEKVVDDGTFVMEIKDKNTASIVAKPGLVLSLDVGEKKSKVVVDLAYAVTTYSPKFSLASYLDILGVKLNSKQKETITGLDCYLIKDEYIMGTFKL